MYLMSRCRTTKEGVDAQIKSASNPGNIGHEWVKKRFIEDCIPNEVTERTSDESGEKFTTQYIPAKLADNKYLHDKGEYERTLKKLPLEERRMLLDGDWSILKGQFFSEWRVDKHVVKPFEIPKWWTRIRGLDWGWSASTAILWIAFSPEGKAFVYKELVVTETIDEALVAKIEEMSKGEEVSYTMADPALWSTNQSERGESIAMRLSSLGVPLIKGDNNRVSGWNVIHSYLFHDDNTPPKLSIFENCHYLIKTLPGLIRDQNKPEDVDTRGEDHAADALRYALMTKPIVSKNAPARSVPDMSFEYWAKKIDSAKEEQGYVGTF